MATDSVAQGTNRAEIVIVCTAARRSDRLSGKQLSTTSRVVELGIFIAEISTDRIPCSWNGTPADSSLAWHSAASSRPSL
ncbi:hypothetical protein CH284_21345 [Rhodococcus sp. 06-156-3]|nr:hypothetical protein CH280_17895 [Rhodococcus sp. 06-156-4C]OZD31342.1 hypothetical protein CH284_21345 [Rhodococcus sp. 06-156-3]OZF65607.1 hypothetical protein CH290_09150 [Rhodococcus sp. 06-156-4]